MTFTTFPALGTSVYAAVRDARELATAHRLAVEILKDVDEVCSRFRSDSDLIRVNASPGSWVPVDPSLVAAVEVAIDAARQTDGLVNPLLGRPLVQLGYDRDFALLTELEEEGPVEAPHIDDWQRIALDPGGRLRIPAGTALDLGATGKAWAADLIAAAYEQELSGSALISVGGDLRIANPDGHTWEVAVSERPGDTPELVSLDHGGLATSSTRIRRWTRRGIQRHHLLDPRTGQPAPEVWRTVTATGPTCTAANTASTAAIVLGESALGWLEDRSVDARLVAGDGVVHTVGAWPTNPSERNVA